MGSSLGFHIILACMGIAFPAIVLVVHYRGLRRKDEVALLLARRWSRVMAVLVAVGAVSGTVLSFDMGLLWPGLMGKYGSAIGIPFSFEGIFFLLEAVFTAIYLYGWDRLPPWAALLDPRAGGDHRHSRRHVGGGRELVDERPFRLHHGARPDHQRQPGRGVLQRRHLLRGPAHDPGRVHGGRRPGRDAVRGRACCGGRRDRYTGSASCVPFTIAAIATPFQIGVGDTAARAIASQQPVKFASMEYVAARPRGALPSGSAASGTTATSSAGIPTPGRRFAAGRASRRIPGRRAGTACRPR